MMIWMGDKVPGVWAVEIWAGGCATFSERGRCAGVWVRRFSSAPESGYTGSAPYAADAAVGRPLVSAGYAEHVLRVVPLAVRTALCQ